MKWIILIAAALFATSCSNDNGSNVVPVGKTGNLKVDISTEAVGGGLKANATNPVYVKGVTLTADNTEYTEVVDNVQTFYFSDAPEGATETSEDNVVMKDLTVGTTTITAVGIAANIAKNQSYIIPADEVTEYPADSELDSRAGAYGAYFVNAEKAQKHGIYADYSSEASDEVVVTNTETRGVDLVMVTENHRLVVVLENPSSSLYDLEMAVYEGDREMFNSKNILPNNDNLMNQGERVAYIINNAAATGDKTYTLKVKYYNTSSHEVVRTDAGVEKVLTSDIVADASTNTNKLFRFRKENLLDGDVSVDLTWVWLTEINSGGVLTDE